MSDDLLQQMTNALRDEYDGAVPVPEATRARVIRALGERRPRRRKWLAVGIPLLALMGGSTAWAAATGRLDHIVEQALSIVAPVADEAPQEQAEPNEGARRTGAVPKAVPELPDETEKEEEEPEEASEPEETEQEKDETAKAAQEPAPTPSHALVRQPTVNLEPPSDEGEETESEEPKEPEEDHTALLTYRGAHRAQFASGDCSEAIVGYAQYLDMAPSGPFAVDARYNRGVCLIRLGRHGEARIALEPFAQGKYGDYRRAQSEQLLEALDGSREEPSE